MRWMLMSYCVCCDDVLDVDKCVLRSCSLCFGMPYCIFVYHALLCVLVCEPSSNL